MGVIIRNGVPYGGGYPVIMTTPVSAAVGATSVTIQNAAITANSTIDIYAGNASNTSPKNLTKTVSSGQVVLTFDALEEATSFKLHIW